MYIFHEGFDVGLWYFKVALFANGLFMYSPFYTGHDGDEGYVFHPLFCILLINGSYLACLCVRACSGNMS